jgi:hypothetical protein
MFGKVPGAGDAATVPAAQRAQGLWPNPEMATRRQLNDLAASDQQGGRHRTRRGGRWFGGRSNATPASRDNCRQPAEPPFDAASLPEVEWRPRHIFGVANCPIRRKPGRDQKVEYQQEKRAGRRTRVAVPIFVTVPFQSDA